MSMRSDASICVDATRKLFHQISFPGPDVEASEYHVEALVDLMRENEAQCKKEARSK
jgi:hypothetical protein